MRWPIRIQLLLPMLTLVVGAIAIASAASAYVSGKHARDSQDENLKRVVATLSDARFPLSEPVLRQMSGLSGAEFVYFEGDNAPRASTLRLSKADLDLLKNMAHEGGQAVFSGNQTTLLGGLVYLSQRVAVREREPAAPAGSLIVLYPEERWWSTAYQAAYPAIMAGAIAVIAVILVTTILAHRFVRPIYQLGDHAAAIARGDFKPLPVASRDDEIRDLSLSINQMARQLGEYENEVRRNEQLRTLGTLGAGMAHQLRNAATGALMAIELHKRHCNSGGDKESLDVALRQLQLMESYLKRFLTLGRSNTAPFETLSLGTILKDALDLVRPACAHSGIELQCPEPDKAIYIRGDAESLRQLVVNLVINAVEAVGRHPDLPGKISVELDIMNEKRAALHVRDSGPGPAQDVAGRLFEPFVSGKSEGTGLGLFVARQAAEAHQGKIHWRRENDLTCFTVEFPMVKND
jgi:signal transduction histidine kinase